MARRAQQAIRAVLSSQVYASHLLDSAAGEPVLRRHEWEIAVNLREITRLRAQTRSVPVPGPQTEAVLASHHRALELAENATVSRICALENYARPIQAAEAAHRDWQNAVRAADLNHQYLDLVARTAADQHAITELTGLTSQATTAASALQHSLRQATMAAQPVALP
ncbi:MAG TPA: hypothetical protein VFQ44_14660 [Streptosporangiaceae bacterium]|nr:hypothetical protein [Streptosporangiaceae bacterium]